MEKSNLKPAKFERSLSIIHAPATIAKLLDIKKDRLIYCIEFIGRTQDDQLWNTQRALWIQTKLDLNTLYLKTRKNRSYSEIILFRYSSFTIYP